MKKRPTLSLIFSLLFLNSCFLNKPESVKHLVKDFNLSWQTHARNSMLYVNLDHSEYGGIKAIDKTIFAVGWNEDFIIALQDPQSTKTEEIEIENTGAYQPKDTVYHIVDIREYHVYYWSVKENVYSFESTAAFQAKRSALGVPESLDFTLSNLD